MASVVSPRRGHSTRSSGRRRLAGAAALTTLALALSACATGNPLVDDPNGPAVSGPAGGRGPSPACAAAFPDSPFGYSVDPGEAPTVPHGWAAPAGVELCVVFQTSEDTAVLQYVTALEPEAVLDAWEPLLGGYAVERSDGIGGWPILNAHAGDLEFALQTDGQTNTVVVGFQEGGA